MEIERLSKMLTDAGIAHLWFDRSTYMKCRVPKNLFGKKSPKWGYQIRVLDKNGKEIVSAIEGLGTYGYGGIGHGFDGTDETDGDLIEIMGLLTPEEEKYDSVVGYLTAEEVFRRIKEAVG